MLGKKYKTELTDLINDILEGGYNENLSIEKNFQKAKEVLSSNRSSLKNSARKSQELADRIDSMIDKNNLATQKNNEKSAKLIRCLENDFRTFTKLKDDYGYNDQALRSWMEQRIDEIKEVLEG